jgi:hypothetical protein
MKKIQSYTLGWDTIQKLGYINLKDEGQKEHTLGKLGAEEFAIMLGMLAKGDVFFDEQNWIIAGWRPKTE